MLTFITRFTNDESGAETLEWVAVAGGLVAAAVLVYTSGLFSGVTAKITALIGLIPG